MPWSRWSTGPGRFGDADVLFVWAILAGFSLGLPAATQARLYSSAFYALRDTTTPFRIAMVRVLFGTALGVALAFGLPAMLGLPRRWGVVGLALSGGLAAWLEMLLLRRALGRRLEGTVRMPPRFLSTVALAAALAAAGGWGGQWGMASLGIPFPPIVESGVVLLVFGALYLLLTTLFRVEEARLLTGRLRRRLGRRA